MFLQTSCPRQDGPVADFLLFSAYCAECELTRPVPPFPPRPSLSDGFSGQPFESPVELRRAVDSYVLDNRNTTDVAVQYGWPISKWDVSRIEDFSRLFSAKRNPLMIRFNDVLYNWQMSSAKNLAFMFEGAVSFTDEDHSLYNWDVSGVTSMQKMFADSAFQGNLWGWYVFGCFALVVINKPFLQKTSGRSVESVEDFSFMFEFATQFGVDTSIDRWNTRSAKDMTAMVRSTILLTSLTVSSFGVRQAFQTTLKIGILAAYKTLLTCKFCFHVRRPRLLTA